MYVYLTVVEYRRRYILLAIWSMALFHLFLRRRPSIMAYELLGTGRSGTFDLWPNWRQWAILHFSPELLHPAKPEAINDVHQRLYGPRIAWWWRTFAPKAWTICLELVEGHGSWNGFTPPKPGATPLSPDEPMAVLTRATIRWRKLSAFWSRAKLVSATMNGARGLRHSIGIGEVPVIKQATFSIWESSEAMKAFAYQRTEHRDVVRDSRKLRWYSEEMFLRMRPVYQLGTITNANGIPVNTGIRKAI